MACSRSTSFKISPYFRALQHHGETFRLSDAIFYISKDTKSSASKSRENEQELKEALEIKKDEIDQEKYPEFYRKTIRKKGTNDSTSKPFGIGILQEVWAQDLDGLRNIRCRVRKLYRPENVKFTSEEAFAKDLNLLFWSDEIITVESVNICGKCFVKNEAHLTESLDSWSMGGEYRFYFNKAYNRQTRALEELPDDAERYGMEHSKGKGKGKGKGKKTSKPEGESGANDASNKVNIERLDGALPPLDRPLNCLDVFAGCGGLSLGLHQSGVANSRWAIEVFEPAAKAYKLNNPDCEVFTDDCNVLLRQAMNGEEFSSKRQRLPKKGEVELLCGGPPCQGFSGMNRFNHREYSAFKNSLISTYLSYCDFYRPKYFILENVRNFATFKKSAVLRLCMKALLKMGYSCSFAILQAGHFGVAQTRRRCILIAAAPGEVLPLFPEPQHVFAETSLSAQIGEVLCKSNSRWTESAPYRTITVRDCMSDLPELSEGNYGMEVCAYGGEPLTHFQKIMRKGTDCLRDHMVKKMSPLVEARMSLIPTTAGSDWRDLPNIRMKLRDGSFTELLVYRYNDYREGKGKNGALRGVCFCATNKNKKCPENNEDIQSNTLIPWCLPHTSARHNQWAGLYGRLDYDGFFSTTVTNPEPMGKQGRVLHPEQHRVVSVRECARSQGFPDWYRFYGTVLERHRQVGNAVAPPMGRALGIQVRKAVAEASAKRRAQAIVEDFKNEIKEEKKEDVDESSTKDAMPVDRPSSIESMIMVDDPELLDGSSSSKTSLFAEENPPTVDEQANKEASVTKKEPIVLDEKLKKRAVIVLKRLH